MKNYDELTNDLLERRDRYVADQKKKRKTITRLTTSICSLVLVTLLGIGVWQSGWLNPVTPPNTDDLAISDDNQTSNTDKTVGITPDAPIIWGEANGEIQDAGFGTWNGKRITLSLHDVLSDEKNKDCLIAIGVSFELDNQFVYNGKTISEYEAEADNAELLINRLGELLKIGDELKYGEALYKTGNPNGIKWAKQLYDETVERIGKDVLSTYIVDGEFLKDKLEADIAAYDAATSSRNAWNEAIEAYYEFIAKETAEQLKKQNVNCEVKKGLIVYVSVEEFSVIEIENVIYYSLAFRESEGMDFIENSADDLVISE